MVARCSGWVLGEEKMGWLGKGNIKGFSSDRNDLYLNCGGGHANLFM